MSGDGAPKSVGAEHSDLTRLADLMLEHLHDRPGVRAVVFLDDAYDGTIAIGGYDDSDPEFPAVVMVDLTEHFRALAESYGLTAGIVIVRADGR